MKKLRITVNGKVYDVEVQVLQDDEAIGSPASLPYPGAAALPIPEAARPASAPAQAPVPGGAGDPNVIASTRRLCQSLWRMGYALFRLGRS